MLYLKTLKKKYKKLRIVCKFLFDLGIRTEIYNNVYVGELSDGLPRNVQRDRLPQTHTKGRDSKHSYKTPTREAVFIQVFPAVPLIKCKRMTLFITSYMWKTFRSEITAGVGTEYLSRKIKRIVRIVPECKRRNIKQIAQ